MTQRSFLRLNKGKGPSGILQIPEVARADTCACGIKAQGLEPPANQPCEGRESRAPLGRRVVRALASPAKHAEHTSSHRGHFKAHHLAEQLLLGLACYHQVVRERTAFGYDMETEGLSVSTCSQTPSQLSADPRPVLRLQTVNKMYASSCERLCATMNRSEPGHEHPAGAESQSPLQKLHVAQGFSQPHI